jgi:transposase-like protein
MRQRSSYPKPFKAQVVQECLQPGATISSVAILSDFEINAKFSKLMQLKVKAWPLAGSREQLTSHHWPQSNLSN